MMESSCVKVNVNCKITKLQRKLDLFLPFKWSNMKVDHSVIIFILTPQQSIVEGSWDRFLLWCLSHYSLSCDLVTARYLENIVKKLCSGSRVF